MSMAQENIDIPLTVSETHVERNFARVRDQRLTPLFQPVDQKVGNPHYSMNKAEAQSPRTIHVCGFPDMIMTS